MSSPLMCLSKHLPLGDLVHDAKESYFQDSNLQSSKALVVFVLPTGFEPVIFAVVRNRGYKPLKVFIITPANYLDVASHLQRAMS